MTFEQFITILKARWRAASLVFFGIVGVVLAVSLLLPKEYTATASVVVEIRTPGPIAGSVLSGMMALGYLIAQVDVIRSEPVALRALRSMHLADSAELREQWQRETEGRGNFESWLAKVLLNKLDVLSARESNVITINYTSPDPVFSAAVTNEFVRAYIDTTLDPKVDPARQSSSFFDDRAQIRETLAQAQSKLSAFQRSKGIVANDQQIDVENARLAELSSQLLVLQGAGMNAERMQAMINNPTLEDLSAELTREQAKLDQMNQRLGERNPQVIERRAHVARLRARIESETQRVSSSPGVNSAVNGLELAQLRASLNEQRARVLRLKSEHDEAAVLQRDVENAQRAYDDMLERLSQTRLESRNMQTSVSELKAATEPAFASSPRVLLNTALAVVAGGLLAIGVAMTRELLDRRVRSEQDVTGGLMQSMLTAIPGPDSGDSLGRTRARPAE